MVIDRAGDNEINSAVDNVEIRFDKLVGKGVKGKYIKKVKKKVVKKTDKKTKKRVMKREDKIIKKRNVNMIESENLILRQRLSDLEKQVKKGIGKKVKGKVKKRVMKRFKKRIMKKLKGKDEIKVKKENKKRVKKKPEIRPEKKVKIEINKKVKKRVIKPLQEKVLKKRVIRIDQEEAILRQRLKNLEEGHVDKVFKEIEKEKHGETGGNQDFVRKQTSSTKEKIEKPRKSIIRRFIRKKPVEDKFIDKGPSKSEIAKVTNMVNKIKKEISKAVIGQEVVADSLLRGILCNSHVLLEGIPGIAKTLLIRALGIATGCDVKRVQFTVDLLPSDIIGLTTYIPDKGFEVSKGPVFTNFLIADEINRSPPKTQSAMIEVMQEKMATIGKVDYPLPNPFFVMATRNPIENLGVYPLSEAQIDRFLFNVFMGYPESEDELKIMEENMTTKNFEDFGLKPVVTPKDLVEAQKIVFDVYLGPKIKNYILAIVKKTRDKNFEYAEYITYGASPRGSIGLFIAAKANALIDGRGYVLPEDVKTVIHEVLRHRLILSYKATVKKLTTDDVINKILEEVTVE